VTSFADSNVVVYSVDRRNAAKRSRARAVLETSPRPTVSPQVLREAYSVLVGKLELDPQAATAVVGALEPAATVVEDAALVMSAIAASQRFAINVYDAHIIEAARRAGCDEVLSEDLQDGMDFDGVVVRNPFA
jgi:predicted nucleic acid-binding protein